MACFWFIVLILLCCGLFPLCCDNFVVLCCFRCVVLISLCCGSFLLCCANLVVLCYLRFGCSLFPLFCALLVHHVTRDEVEDSNAEIIRFL